MLAAPGRDARGRSGWGQPCLGCPLEGRRRTTFPGREPKREQARAERPAILPVPRQDGERSERIWSAAQRATATRRGACEKSFPCRIRILARRLHPATEIIDGGGGVRTESENGVVGRRGQAYPTGILQGARTAKRGEETMATRETFRDFLRRIRCGDEEAAAELVRLYEPIIRREVRLRMNDPTLVALFNSADFCQSVLRSFFVRAALGQYDLSGPRDLRNLLVRMAHNKVAGRVR